MIGNKIRKCVLLAGLALSVCAGGGGAAWAGNDIEASSDTIKFTSASEAYEQGMGAYRASRLDLAVPALKFAAQENIFLAKYYLAKILSDGIGAHIDHAQAYKLFLQLAEQYRDIDPYSDGRAPYVAQAIIAVARYHRLGLVDLGIRSNTYVARNYLEYAASYFNEMEGQFELAKMYFEGEGGSQDIGRGRHWISTSANRGHVQAQAYLASLFWNGRYNFSRDPVMALTYVTLALENAPEHELIWITELHHQIYCGSSETVRREAERKIARWRMIYMLPEGRRTVSELRVRDGGALRACQSGDLIELPGDRTGPAIEAAVDDDRQWVETDGGDGDNSIVGTAIGVVPVTGKPATSDAVLGIATVPMAADVPESVIGSSVGLGLQ